MAIKEKTVKIKPRGQQIQILRGIGYEIPIYIDRFGDERVRLGTEIIVLVSDLPEGSNILVTKVCDYNFEGCLVESKDQPYSAIMRSRKDNGSKLDACKKCSRKIGGNTQKTNVKLENSLGFNVPDILPYWHPMNNKNPFELSLHNTDKYFVRCKIDDRHIYEVSPSKIASGRGCPFCSSQKIHITNCLYTYDSELSLYCWDWDTNLQEFGVTPFDVPIRSEKKVFWICIKCNEQYPAVIKDMTRYERHGCCSKCSVVSKAEKKISDYLDSLNVKYKTQVRFDNCRYKKKMPFDFGVYNDRGDLLFLIEYDGEQHFRPRRDEKDDTRLLKRQMKDKLKSDYCVENSIPLFRISYRKINHIEKILRQILNSYISNISTLSEDFLSSYLVNHQNWCYETYKIAGIKKSFYPALYPEVS